MCKSPSGYITGLPVVYLVVRLHTRSIAGHPYETLCGQKSFNLSDDEHVMQLRHMHVGSIKIYLYCDRTHVNVYPTWY